MSNDTQIAAHMVLVKQLRNSGWQEHAQCWQAVEASARQLAEQPGTDLRATLETALARIEDMLADDDGQAFKEARKFLESARQLSEQPGFVMVPVDVLERAAQSLGSFVSDHGWSDQDMQNMDNLDAFIARHKANLAARPLTASPTAPSTEASEPVRDERAEHIITKCRDALAEELSAWDIEPPLHHVAEAHDLCEQWLSARALKGTP